MSCHKEINNRIDEIEDMVGSYRIFVRRRIHYGDILSGVSLFSIIILTRTLGHGLSLHQLAQNRTIMGNKTKLKIGEFSRLMQGPYLSARSESTYLAICAGLKDI